MRETRESRHLSYWPADRWVKNWEDFAGKPYVKPRPFSRKPGEIAGASRGAPVSSIKETVRNAQELLCDLYFSPFLTTIKEQAKKLDEDGHRIAFLCGASESYTWPGTTYPQSLGELCIELHNEKLSRSVAQSETPNMLAGYKMKVCGGWINSKHGRDIQDLKTKMYHTHTASTREMRFVPGGWTGMTGYGDGLLTPHNPEICGETEGQDCPIHHPPFTNYPQMNPNPCYYAEGAGTPNESIY